MARRSILQRVSCTRHAPIFSYAFGEPLASGRQRFHPQCPSFSSSSQDDDIEEVNQELEFVFGSSVSSPRELSHRTTNNSPTIVPEEFTTPNDYSSPIFHEQSSKADVSGYGKFSRADAYGKVSMVEQSSNVDIARDENLSHVDAHGKASMVNVSEKVASKRVAVASGKVMLGRRAFALVSTNQIAKGDVLTVAKIAGICGAKQTGNLIPLCHNIALSNVQVSLELDEEENAVNIRGEVSAVGTTGVEMEALTAVSVAGLTVYDMCKAVSKNIKICSVQLESKTGGKSGHWFREN